MPSNRAELTALKNMIEEVDLILSTTAPLPENRTPRCHELLSAAMALANDLIGQGKETPAALLGSKGGSATAQKHGAEHYRLMAAARKTKGGGRPRKQAE